MRARALVALLLVVVARGAVAGETGPRTVPEAVALLTQADPALRARGAAWLGGRRTEGDRRAAVAALRPRLEDADPGVRRAVANALAALGDRAVASALADRLLREPHPEVRAALLVGLGALGGPGDVGTVLPHARDPAPVVRAAALTALGDLGGEDARATALAAVREPGVPDPEWSLRSAAILALARCGRPPDVGEVLVAMRDGEGWRHWFARSAVARLLAAQDPDPVPTLARLAEDPDGRVAVTAAEGVARRGSSSDVMRLLAHVRPEIRAAGAAAVAKAGLAPFLPHLRLMARTDPSRAVRWAAARALFRMEDREGEDLVLEAVGAREPAVWAEAVALLAERTGADHGRDAAAWRAALARCRGGHR